MSGELGGSFSSSVTLLRLFTGGHGLLTYRFVAETSAAYLMGLGGVMPLPLCAVALFEVT